MSFPAQGLQPSRGLAQGSGHRGSAVADWGQFSHWEAAWAGTTHLNLASAARGGPPSRGPSLSIAAVSVLPGAGFHGEGGGVWPALRREGGPGQDQEEVRRTLLEELGGGARPWTPGSPLLCDPGLGGRACYAICGALLGIFKAVTARGPPTNGALRHIHKADPARKPQPGFASGRKGTAADSLNRVPPTPWCFIASHITQHSPSRTPPCC